MRALRTLATSGDNQRYLDRLRQRSTTGVATRPLSDDQEAARRRVQARYRDGTYGFTALGCLCGTDDDPVVVVHSDRYGLPSPTLMCGRCGIARTTPRLDDRSLSLFYEEDYRPLYVGSTSAPEAFYGRQARHGKLVLAYCASGLKAKARVADVGCGAGGVLAPFRDAGHEVVGCDVGSAYLDRGRAAGLDLRHGSLDALADAAPFDLMILSHVVEHVVDPVAFLGSARALLADTGRLYVEVPGLRDIARYGDPLDYFQNAHLFNFDLSTLGGVMAAGGFQLVRGDEWIHSLFRKSETSRFEPNGETARENEAAIASAERMRPIRVMEQRMRVRAKSLLRHGRRTPG